MSPMSYVKNIPCTQTLAKQRKSERYYSHEQFEIHKNYFCKLMKTNIKK